MNQKTFLLISFFIVLVGVVACNVSRFTPAPVGITATQEVTLITTQISTATETHPANPTATLTRTPAPTYTPRPTKIIPPTETPTPLPVFVPQDFSSHPLAGIGTPFAKSGEVITEQNLGRLTELARWGKGVMTDIAFSPDGKWLAVAASTGIYFYDTQTWEESFAINYEKTVWAFAFSQNSDRFAVGFEDRLVQIVDIQSQKLLQAFQMERWPVEIVFLNNDRYLLSTSDYEMAELWDLETNSTVDLLDLAGGSPNYVIPSVDGKIFAVLFGNEMRFWDLETGEFSQSYSSDYKYFSGVAKSTSYFVQSPWGGSFEVRHLENGEIAWSADAWCQDCSEFIFPGEHSPNCEYGIYDEGPSSLSNFQFSPDEKYLITHFLGRIQIRDTFNGELIRQMDANTDLAFSPNSLWMAWGSSEGIVHIEQVSNHQELKTLVGFTPGVQNIKFEPNGNRIAIESWDGFRIRVLNDGGLFRKFEANDLDFSPDGNLIALGYQDGKVEIRTNSDLSLISLLEYSPYPVSQLEFSSQGNWLLSVNDCLVYATNSKNWTHLYSVNALMGPVSVLLSPNEDKFLLSRWDETELYQLSDGVLIDQSNLGLYEEDDAIFLPDGNSVIKFVSGDLSIRDLLGNTIRDISIDRSSSETGQFSPDGSLFATVGWDGGIYIWRVSDWQLLVTLQNSTNRSDSIAFSSDGLYIAIGSYNGTVSIWGIAP